MDSNFGVLITGTLSFLTLSGGLIGVWMKSNERIALAKQEIDYAHKRIDKLEERVIQFEDKISEKLDHLLTTVNDIRIRIAGER